jgi:anti-anti-sigma factor
LAAGEAIPFRKGRAVADEIDIEVVDAESDPAVKIVRLSGSLEHQSISKVNHVVRQLIEAGNVRLAFDCSGLRYVTSPALGIFIGHFKKANAKGGDTKFFGLDENILEVFRIVGLTRTFDIHPDEASAVAAFDVR